MDKAVLKKKLLGQLLPRLGQIGLKGLAKKDRKFGKPGASGAWSKFPEFPWSVLARSISISRSTGYRPISTNSLQWSREKRTRLKK